MRRQLLQIIGTALVLLFTATATVSAHEGHGHHLMGTVIAVEAARLDLTTTEGKAASVGITAETKVFKGKTQASVADIKKGARVMIDTDGATEHPKAVTIYLGADAK
jgi:Cu/Ag efflux protein CusF